LPLPCGGNQERRLPFMSGKIFYRERQRYVDGAEHPRFLLVAVHDVNLKVYGQHLRMSELKTIAEATGAELIALPRCAERNGRIAWRPKAPRSNGGEDQVADTPVRTRTAGQPAVLYFECLDAGCPFRVIHVIPAIPACPARPKSGHSANARVY